MVMITAAYQAETKERQHAQKSAEKERKQRKIAEDATKSERAQRDRAETTLKLMGSSTTWRL